ncbi:hypothetical protein H0H87_012206, partial [Tephrocybe sp. NHM501043]
GVTITTAAAPDWPTCPIAALKAMYIELPHQAQAPLFKQPNGKPLSYSFFIKHLWDSLTLTGSSQKTMQVTAFATAQPPKQPQQDILTMKFNY